MNPDPAVSGLASKYILIGGIIPAHGFRPESGTRYHESGSQRIQAVVQQRRLGAKSCDDGTKQNEEYDKVDGHSESRTLKS